MARDFFDKDNYVGVNERISKFREDHPQGLINTFREKGESCEYFKAVVFRNLEEAKLYPPIAAASGHAEIVDNGGKKSFEKAETVAIGRALAILGYEVKKGLASAEEMEQFEEQEASAGKSRFSRDEEESAPKSSRFNRPAKEEKAAKAEEEEEAPKKSRFARSAPKKEEVEEDSSNEEAVDEEDKKTKLKSSRPFKSGSRFTRGA